MDKKVGRIRDVAKETGLSIATISRVMNGATNVSPSTRDKVLSASRKLNYLPNPAARALSTSKSRTIAAIIPTIEHSVFAKYIAAIEETLATRGYSLVLAISNGDPDTELAAARKLLGMGAEAFILSGADHLPELTDLFDSRDVPHVYTSIWDPTLSVPTIGYDNRALALMAAEYLIEKGHRDIAVIHGPLAVSDRFRARRDGVLQATAAADLTFDFFETSLDVVGGRQVIDRVLGSTRNYSAAFCFSDVLALGAYFGLNEAGLKIPEDVSVMGFDNLDWTGIAAPPLTTVNLPARKMGADVASQIMKLLEDDEPVLPNELKGHLIERQSVKTRPAHRTENAASSS